MTINEYMLRMKAWALKELDERRKLLQYAFDKRLAEATVGKGKSMKYRFSSPDEVLKFDEAEKKIVGDPEKSRILKRLHIIAENQRYLRR